MKSGLIGVFFLIFLSCGKPIRDLQVLHPGGTIQISDEIHRSSSLSLSFLGVMTFQIHTKDVHILSDPFVSNPSLLKFGRIKPHTKRIEEAYQWSSVRELNLLFIGHGHYDHALDVSLIYPELPSKATIVSSKSYHHMTASLFSKAQKWALEDHLDPTNPPFFADTSGRVRFHAFSVNHPPHVGKITLFKGSYLEDRRKLPKHLAGWKLGHSYAFLVDFMNEDGTIEWRVWLQTSVGEQEELQIPQYWLEERPVDLAILSIALKKNRLDGFVHVVDQIRPRVMMLGHWENFFRAQHKKPQWVTGGAVLEHIDVLRNRYPNTEIILPAWKSSYEIHK